MTADVDALDTVFLLAIGPFLAALVMGGVMTAILFAILPSAGWIYLCAMILAVMIVPAILIGATRKAGKSLVEAAATLRTNVLDAVMGHDDIVVFGQSATILDGFENSGKSPVPYPSEPCARDFDCSGKRASRDGLGTDRHRMARSDRAWQSKP